METLDTRELVSSSISPGPLTESRRNFRTWSSITICPKCGQRASYYDQHPVNPCMTCGHRSVKETVGRWVEKPIAWYDFWTKPEGFWELKGDKK